MNSKFLLKHLILFGICGLLLLQCSRDESVNSEIVCNEMVTYNDVKIILDASCAFTTDCHASGGISPDYTTYENMEPSLRNGDFKNRVILIRDMPELPTVLDSLELRMLRCWDQDNYLEN